MAATSAADDIKVEIPTYITVYKNGTVDRPRQTPFVLPSLHDPETRKFQAHYLGKSVHLSSSLPSKISSVKGTHPEPEKFRSWSTSHGGGFFFESAFSELYHSYFVKFVSQIDVLVVSVEYKLAPDHFLPVAYE